jgi:hypothetical protein
MSSYSQLQTGAPVPGVDHYNGMFDCFRKIVKNEGYVIALRTNHRSLSNMRQ